MSYVRLPIFSLASGAHPSPSTWMEPPSRCSGLSNTCRPAFCSAMRPAALSLSQLGTCVCAWSCQHLAADVAGALHAPVSGRPCTW